MAYDIFISYRRIGGYETAKHLFDLLSRDGYNVSFDIDTLRNGDFDVELLKRVEECTDFILILNQGAFDRTIDPNFDPQKDWLRQELAHALKLGKNIIPIMLNGFTEFPDNLPTDVARVQKKNGPKYDQYYFDGFYQKLVDVFLETPKPVKATVQATTPKPTMGTLLVDTDLDCFIFNYGKAVGIAKAGVYTTFELPLGDNALKYVELESGKDCYDEIVTILENHQKLIRVKLLDTYNARKAKEETERKEKEEAERKEKIKKTFEVGEDYYYGRNGKIQSYTDAEKFYRIAAEQGHEDAQNNLGMLYANGEGVQVNYTEAAKWFRKAAEQGSAESQFALGWCYENGRGVTLDYYEAAKWTRKAAEQGHTRSQYALGRYLSTGYGVQQNHTEAAKWFRKAAEQGHAIAQNSLGYCYIREIGVRKDDAEAVKWYRKAAEQGHADAQNNLGGCYYTGTGVRKDKTEAAKWFRKAAEQGHDLAKKQLEKYYNIHI